MNTRIEIEKIIIKDKEKEKEVLCYIPYINDIPVLGTGYIFKESINNEKKITDNLELAKFFLQNKINEINKFINSNGKFLEKNNNILDQN